MGAKDTSQAVRGLPWQLSYSTEKLLCEMKSEREGGRKREKSTEDIVV